MSLPFTRPSMGAPRRRWWLTTAVAAAATLCHPLAGAQAAAPWQPTKPIRLVVGYAAGGATDVIARLVAARLGERLGQPVLVDNRAGANSNIGAEAVVKASPDGYTLYVYTVANTVNASLYDKLSYDPLKDFEPIGLIARVPNVLVVNPASPARNVADFVKLAQDPKGLAFASSGSGSTIHLSGELFKVVAKVNLLHVPYRGSAPALADLMGGQVQAMFDNTPSVLPHVKAGKLRALAITSAQRSPLLPEVPTLAESGFPGFDVQSWFSLAAPAGTPRAIVNRLNTELNKVLAEPELSQRLRDMAATPEPGTPAQLQSLITSEARRWRDIIKQAGIKPD